jgi:RNA polymerase sigma-70 factor, ECF subfamily
MPTTTLVPARPAAPSAASPSHGGPRGASEMLAALYDDYGSGLRRFAAALTGDHGRAENVVQETMLRAWRHPEAADERRGDPRSWLYTVARRVVIDQHRARQARPAEVVGVAALAGRAASDQIDAAITSWDLAAALHSLQPRHRDLLAAHYLRDRSIAEIAATLRVPAGTVRSRLSAARDALRQRLQTGNGFRGRQESITEGRAR